MGTISGRDRQFTRAGWARLQSDTSPVPMIFSSKAFGRHKLGIPETFLHPNVRNGKPLPSLRLTVEDADAAAQARRTSVSPARRPVSCERSMPLYNTLIGVDMVITTLSTLSSCCAALPVRITPNSMRDRRLDTVMFALPMYALRPRSTLIALK